MILDEKQMNYKAVHHSEHDVIRAYQDILPENHVENMFLDLKNEDYDTESAIKTVLKDVIDDFSIESKASFDYRNKKMDDFENYRTISSINYQNLKSGLENIYKMTRFSKAMLEKKGILKMFYSENRFLLKAKRFFENPLENTNKGMGEFLRLPKAIYGDIKGLMQISVAQQQKNKQTHRESILGELKTALVKQNNLKIIQNHFEGKEISLNKNQSQSKSKGMSIS